LFKRLGFRLSPVVSGCGGVSLAKPLANQRAMLEGMDDLSQAAKFAVMSLEAHPELNTPEAIANGPFSIQQINERDVHEGLVELERRGMARETAGRWELIGG
jgi:hypothetical protein